MKDLYFEGFGELPYIPRSEYIAGDFRYVGTEHEFYDEPYDVVVNRLTGEYFYTQI